MAVSMSMRFVILLVIGVLFLILGVVLISNATEIKEVLPEKDFLVPEIREVIEDINVRVVPESSQRGTEFLIVADIPLEREEQDFRVIVEGGGFVRSVFLFDDGKHFDEVKGDGIYGGFFDSGNAEIGDYVIRVGDREFEGFEIYAGLCEGIIGGVDKNKINLVALPYGYDNYEEFRSNVASVLLDENSLFDVEPFISNKDKFSFATIDTDRDLKCEVGCFGVDTLVCCNDKAVFEEASRCHYDSAIVFINEKKLCGSASSYSKICAGNDFSKQILKHEIGHSFADLADEYVYSDVYSNYEVGDIESANCDVEGCDKWSSYEEVCIEGCTYSDLYRPSEKSIMFSLAENDYNLVSQVHIAGLLNDYVEKTQEIERGLPLEKSYVVNVDYEEGKFNIENVYLKPIFSNFDLKKSEYEAVVKNKNGKELFRTNVKIPNVILPFENSAGPIVLDQMKFTFLLPFSAEGNDIEILKNGEIVERQILDVFGDQCGDRVCGKSENHASCNLDCNIEDDGICELSECDPDCPSQVRCGNFFNGKKLFGFVLILLGLFEIVFVFVKIRKK